MQYQFGKLGSLAAVVLALCALFQISFAFPVNTLTTFIVEIASNKIPQHLNSFKNIPNLPRQYLDSITKQVRFGYPFYTLNVALTDTDILAKYYENDPTTKYFTQDNHEFKIKYHSHNTPGPAQSSASTTEQEFVDGQWYQKRILRRGKNDTSAHSEFFKRQGEGVMFYVLDSGVNTHPELGDRVIHGWSTVTRRRYHNDTLGHGTALSSLLIGQNLGIAPKANVVSVQIACKNRYRISDIIEGFAFVYQDVLTHRRPSIITFSWMLRPNEKIIYSAMNTLVNINVLIVTAAGNDNGLDACQVPPVNTQPGKTPHLSVGAIDNNDEIASFSNLGECVSIFAPGKDLLVANAYNSHYRLVSGTSYAAPLVAGISGLLLSYNPNWTPWDISKIVLAAATRNVIIRRSNDTLMERTPDRLLYAGIELNTEFAHSLLNEGGFRSSYTP